MHRYVKMPYSEHHTNALNCLYYLQSDVVEREATAKAALFNVALSQVKRLRIARGEVVMATRMASDVRARGDGEREGDGADESRETHDCEVLQLSRTLR